MRNAICFAATEDFMVLCHAVTLGYRFSVQLNAPRRRLPTLCRRTEWQTGPDGARVLDIFSPPRPEYKKAGSGFG